VQKRGVTPTTAGCSGARLALWARKTAAARALMLASRPRANRWNGKNEPLLIARTTQMEAYNNRSCTPAKMGIAQMSALVG